MRILPSQSTRHEAERGIDQGVHHFEVQLVSLRDARANKRRRRRPADPLRAQFGGGDRLEIDDLPEFADVGRDVIVRAGAAAFIAFSKGIRLTPLQSVGNHALARFSIHLVA